MTVNEVAAAATSGLVTVSMAMFTFQLLAGWMRAARDAGTGRVS